MLLSRHGLGIFFIFLASVLTDQVLSELIQDEIGSPNGTSSLIWVYGGLSLVAGLLYPLLICLLAALGWRRPDASIQEQAALHLSYLIKEEMRAFGKTLAWSFLFVVPGVIRFLQFFFIPFVVLFDSEYQNGRCDALVRSADLVNRNWGRLSLTLLTFGLLLPLAMTSFDSARSFLHQPLTAAPLFALEFLLLIVSQRLIFTTWEKAYESDVSKK